MAWNKRLLRGKLRALSIHLAISALAFLPIFYLIWTCWFPAPFFFTDGGVQGLRLMLAVDLVIGPSLTFLIFNTAKSRRELFLDFSLIALIQAAALGYGLYNVEQKRIWVIALQDDTFHAVSGDTYKSQTVPAGQWSQYGTHPPYWVLVRTPKNPDEVAGVGAYAMIEGLDSFQIQYLYEPLSQHLDAIQQSSHTAPTKNGDAAVSDLELQTYKTQHPEALYFIKHQGYFRDAVLAFDAQGRYVGAVYSSTAHTYDKATK